MHPWNYHSHVTTCPTCEGEGRVHSHRRPSTWDPYPENDCPDCDGPHEPECAVCGYNLPIAGYNLPIAGYDCLVCDTVASLHPVALKAFDADVFAAALKVAVGKALTDSLQVAA